MICNDLEPAHWVLVSQVDHATLAGRIAEHWKFGPLQDSKLREQLLAAIFHHDDGWAEWETSPQVNPHTGTPLTFHELEPADYMPIWRRSIAAAEKFGPLAGYCAAGHFCALLERFDSWRKSDDPLPRQLAEGFLTQYAAAMAQWQAEFSRHAQFDAAAAVRTLQLMDFISLWLCAAARDSAYSFADPAAGAVEFKPLGNQLLQVTPWPFGVERLALSIPGRKTPRGFYKNPAELAAAPSQPVQLSWTLQPEPNAAV